MLWLPTISLRDPSSDEPQQPDYAHNGYRSIKPGNLRGRWHLHSSGMSPSHLPDSFWRAGSGSLPASSARVMAPNSIWLVGVPGRPAPLNLVIPPYQFLSDTTILVGADGKGGLTMFCQTHGLDR